MPQVIFLVKFFKKVEKIHVELFSLKERFNKMEIETDSENKSQLKRITKPPLLMSQEKSLTEKIKKYPCLFDKNQKAYKEGDVVKNTWEAVTLELYFIENGMQSTTHIYIISSLFRKIFIHCFSEKVKF